MFTAIYSHSNHLWKLSIKQLTTCNMLPTFFTVFIGVNICVIVATFANVDLRFLAGSYIISGNKDNHTVEVIKLQLHIVNFLIKKK